MPEAVGASIAPPHLDYARLFAAVPSACLVLRPDPPRFSIIDATDAYLVATQTTRPELLGRGLFEAFPSNPDDEAATGTRDLLASLERVLATRSPDVMGLQKYDIPRRSGRPGFDVKYWVPVNTPVLDAQGLVEVILHRVEDVTDYVTGRSGSPGLNRHAGPWPDAEVLRRTREVKDANRRLLADNLDLRRSELRLSAALAVGRLGAWAMDLKARAAERSALHDEIFGLNAPTPTWGIEEILLRVVPEDRPEVEASFRRALDEESVWTVDCRIRRADNGALRWLRLQGRPLRAGGNKVTHLVGVVADVTDQRRAEERQQLLLAELNHRVKNSFAAVQAIATYTLKRAGSLDEARRMMTGRLLALGRAQDLLTSTAGSGADLREIVQRTVAAFSAQDFAASRIAMSGADLALAPKAVIALHAVLHELAVNAAKHGALSVPDGRLSVTWTVNDADGAPTVVILWLEEGGPPTAPPDNRGFGLRLIERSIIGELGGQLSLDFRPAGLSARIGIPLSAWGWVLPSS